MEGEVLRDSDQRGHRSSQSGVRPRSRHTTSCARPTRMSGRPFRDRVGTPRSATWRGSTSWTRTSTDGTTTHRRLTPTPPRIVLTGATRFVTGHSGLRSRLAPRYGLIIGDKHTSLMGTAAIISGSSTYLSEERNSRRTGRNRGSHPRSVVTNQLYVGDGWSNRREWGGVVIHRGVAPPPTCRRRNPDDDSRSIVDPLDGSVRGPAWPDRRWPGIPRLGSVLSNAHVNSMYGFDAVNFTLPAYVPRRSVPIFRYSKM